MTEDIVKELEEEIKNMETVFDDEDKLLKPIEELTLSLKAKNGLKKASVNFVADWIFRNQKSRRSIRSIGEKLFEEIEEEIKKLHILDIFVIEEKIKNADLDCKTRNDLLTKFIMKKEELRQKYYSILQQRQKQAEEEQKKQQREEERVAELKRQEEMKERYEEETRLYELALKKKEMEEKLERARKKFQELQAPYKDRIE